MQPLRLHYDFQIRPYQSDFNQIANLTYLNMKKTFVYFWFDNIESSRPRSNIVDSFRRRK